VETNSLRGSLAVRVKVGQSWKPSTQKRQETYSGHRSWGVPLAILLRCHHHRSLLHCCFDILVCVVMSIGWNGASCVYFCKAWELEGEWASIRGSGYCLAKTTTLQVCATARFVLPPESREERRSLLISVESSCDTEIYEMTKDCCPPLTASARPLRRRTKINLVGVPVFLVCSSICIEYFKVQRHPCRLSTSRCSKWNRGTRSAMSPVVKLCGVTVGCVFPGSSRTATQGMPPGWYSSASFEWPASWTTPRQGTSGSRAQMWRRGWRTF